ncbi:HK97 family phage prohead protease [Diaphorobacter sp.]|uniref:HK97 family phage prohead protease n=1 Tax=Diaphorobacter sp. TaxID=1934310 RepID=UPI002584BEB8|nr:HK97 family phage prohead protease [Diaphorobacter sp.]
MLELRGHGTLQATGKTLHGYAAVFNSEANLGTFSEVIRPGAFAKSLATGSNIRALYQHDGTALLGTTRGGTLQLREDAKGLAFTLALPDTSHGRDLAILVDRGDVQGCSFGFRVNPGGDRWEERGSTMVRELLDVDLAEITLTSDPAYSDTTVALRSKPAQLRVHSDPNFLWLELY